MPIDNKYSSKAEKEHESAAAIKLRVSFEYLDLGLPEFFVHGLTADHYAKLFECINTIANATQSEIEQQNHASLNPKSIFNTTKGTYSRFPQSVEEAIVRKLNLTPKGIDPLDKVAVKNAAEKALREAQRDAKQIVEKAFEVRISKTAGRIHGIVWDKVFYVIWLDPAHNLYPDARNGIRLHEQFFSVKGFAPEDVAALREAHDEHCAVLGEKFQTLQSDHDELLEAFASLPNCTCK